MKITQKGLYAFRALMALGRNYGGEAMRVRDIAKEENLPGKFLELILLELKHARIVESTRGPKGGYQLRQHPSEVPMSQVVRLMDGPLAPFGNVDQLRDLVLQDVDHQVLYQVFLDVRDAAANILENTTIADLIKGKNSSESALAGRGIRTRKRSRRTLARRKTEAIS